MALLCQEPERKIYQWPCYMQPFNISLLAHLYTSSSGKRPVILAKWNAEEQLLVFSVWRPPRPKRRNCKQVWGSSHILLSFPFLTYTFQSQPPTQRWSEWARSSLPSASHCTTAKPIPARASDGRRCEFFMNWNLRVHENRMVTQKRRRTGSLVCRWKKESCGESWFKFC